jgi:hypothetical protein
MRTTTLGLTVAAVLAVAACSPSAPAATAAVDGDLRRDLSLAEAHTGSLTLPGTATRRTEVVSEAELTPRAEVPVRAAPSPRAKRQARVKQRWCGRGAARARAAPEPAPAPEEVEAVAVWPPRSPRAGAGVRGRDPPTRVPGRCRWATSATSRARSAPAAS